VGNIAVRNPTTWPLFLTPLFAIPLLSLLERAGFPVNFAVRQPANNFGSVSQPVLKWTPGELAHNNLLNQIFSDIFQNFAKSPDSWKDKGTPWVHGTISSSTANKVVKVGAKALGNVDHIVHGAQALSQGPKYVNKAVAYFNAGTNCTIQAAS